MQPIKFNLQNITFAEDQEEYLPLPAFVDYSRLDKPVISCWQLTWKERVQLLFTGKIWMSQLIFEGPLQPQMLHVECPIVLNELDQTGV